MLQLPARFRDQILVPTAQVRHVRLAHRHVPPDRPASIEVMGDGPAPRLRHEGLQSNHFIPYPLGLGLCADCLGPHWLPCPRPVSPRGARPPLEEPSETLTTDHEQRDEPRPHRKGSLVRAVERDEAVKAGAWTARSQWATRLRGGIADQSFELGHGQNGGRHQFSRLREVVIPGDEPVRPSGEGTGQKYRIGGIWWIGQLKRHVN